MLLIFKKYLYKARQNKDLNFNILKNYLTKVRDLEANLKDNDKYNKKQVGRQVGIFRHKKYLQIMKELNGQ